MHETHMRPQQPDNSSKHADVKPCRFAQQRHEKPKCCMPLVLLSPLRERERERERDSSHLFQPFGTLHAWEADSTPRGVLMWT